MDADAARNQMLGQQIRAWEVLDDRVLDALRAIRRERFVPPEYQELAFADIEVPLAHGQRMLAPKIEGRILQALALDQTDDVFEVGTGSAYLTACLARLSRSVVSVDIFSDFIEAAKPKLASSGIRNVTLETADALQLRYREEFDAIAVTGSLPSLDRHFIDMLRPGGRLFVVVGRLPIMEAKFIRLQSDGSWIEESLFETVLPPLINSEHSEPFAL